MALLRTFDRVKGAFSSFRTPATVFRMGRNEISTTNNVLSDDMPVKMENPFEKEKPKCILCKFDIEPNFKNVRLLSQFVSRHTGRVYGRHITGLCEAKHKKVEKEVRKARSTGLMAYYLKEPNYMADPSLYNDAKPLIPHKYI